MIIAGLLVGARIAVAGLALGWMLPSAGRGAPWARRLSALSALCVLGVAANALAACVLGEWGLFTPAWDLAALAVVCGLGILGACVGGRLRFVQWLRDAAGGAVLLPCVCAGLLSLPGRGEWIAGGWDPGVYVNQGLALERTGRHDPGVLGAYRDMDAQGFDFFTRGSEGYRECFPAVPIDPRTRESRAYFFRLMPSWVAVLARCGGVAAAVRVNLVTAVAVVLALAGLALASGGGVVLAAFAALLFAAHPLLLYHVSVPTSELLQGMLVLGLFGCLGAGGVNGERRGWARAVAGALLTLAAVLNRVSFVPFGAMFLAVAAWVERDGGGRGEVGRTHAAWFAGLAAGAVWTWVASGPALVRLSGELPEMAVMTGLGLAAAAGVHAAAATPRGCAWLRHLPAWWPRIVWFLAVGALLVVLRGGRGEAMRNLEGNLGAAMPYLGWPLVVCAVAGAGWLCWRSDPAWIRSVGGFAAFGSAVTALLIVNQSIAQIYPWAMRRYVEFTVPLLCLLAAIVPAACFGAARGRRSAVLAVAACVLWLVPCMGGARRAVHAWRCTAYDGLVPALEAVAARIGPGGIVVADDPRWGTPLLLGWGCDGVNGKPLCAAPDATAAAPGVAALDAVRRSGRQVLFLTSTGEGMGIFRAAFPGAALTAEWPPLETREPVHSRRATDFSTRPRRIEFRLHTWSPPPPPPGKPADPGR